MKRATLLILSIFVTIQNSEANQIVDISTVDELKIAYGSGFNVYVSPDSPFYFIGELSKENLMQACFDNGYNCVEQGEVIKLSKYKDGKFEEKTILPNEVLPVKPIKKIAKSIRNKPESFSSVENFSVAGGKIIYKENDELDENLISADFIKSDIYIYSQTDSNRKVSLFDEIISSLSPFSLSKKFNLPMDFLFNNKNIADFFDSRNESFYFSKTSISCVTGDYCEVLNESRYEYDETVRTEISESTSKRFDVVTQGFKLRFRAESVDLEVSFCEDRYNCIRFSQVSERKVGGCYELFYKTDIKLNSRFIFGQTKTTKINNLGFVICEKK